MSDFLPNDYEIPVSASKYTKLKDGIPTPKDPNQVVTRLRILSSPIIGWERWADNVERIDGSTGRGPIRGKNKEDLDPQFGMGGDKGWKHFWAMTVWNVDAKCIQVWNITQKTIMSSLKAVAASDDWGNPKDFDILITRIKTGSEAKNVDYTLMPTPKKELSKEILEAYEEVNVDLERLFDSQNPFSEDIDPKKVKLDEKDFDLGSDNTLVSQVKSLAEKLKVKIDVTNMTEKQLQKYLAEGSKKLANK